MSEPTELPEDETCTGDSWCTGFCCLGSIHPEDPWWGEE